MPYSITNICDNRTFLYSYSYTSPVITYIYIAKILHTYLLRVGREASNIFFILKEPRNDEQFGSHGCKVPALWFISWTVSLS